MRIGFPESVIFIALAAILVFEIWMLIAVWRNSQLAQQQKILWTVGMCLLHPFVALYYYFTVYTQEQN